MGKLSLLYVAVFAALATPAFATGEIVSLITKADTARLEQYETTRASALAEARAGAAAADVEKLEAVVSSRDISMQGFDLGGKWKCRTIKVGKSLPVVIYQSFDCRVTDDGSGWRLEKLSGSQRTTGRFFDDGDARLTYLGSGFMRNDKSKAYGSGPETDQVGYAFRNKSGGWRIEFPAPINESALDILEFQRP